MASARGWTRQSWFAVAVAGVALASGCQVLSGIADFDVGEGAGASGGQAGSGGAGASGNAGGVGNAGNMGGAGNAGGVGNDGGAGNAGGTGGACNPADCDPYMCDPNGGDCLTSCEQDRDCQGSTLCFGEPAGSCLECGMSPPGGQCIPSVCTGAKTGCNQEVCEKVCDGAICQANFVLDATTGPATVACSGQDCNDVTITCVGAYPCTVDCSTSACTSLTLQCGDGPCQLECNDSACAAAAINCGDNVCATCGSNFGILGTDPCLGSGSSSCSCSYESPCVL